MAKHEQVHRDPAVYEAPVLEPARARFGAQERVGMDWSANIICSSCSNGT